MGQVGNSPLITPNDEKLAANLISTITAKTLARLRGHHFAIVAANENKAGRGDRTLSPANRKAEFSW